MIQYYCTGWASCGEHFPRTQQLLKSTESVQIDHIALKCGSTCCHTVPQRLHWRTLDEAVLLYVLFAVPEKIA